MGLKNKITREVLKEKVGDQNIFDFYFPQPVEIGKSYISAFRDEQHPSTSFFVSENGSLIYRDFTTNDTYDCVKFVMRLFGLTYYKALEQIAVDFGLIPGQLSKGKLAVIKAAGAVKVPKKKKFLITTTPLQKRHLEYWAQYGITKKDLIVNNIKAISKLKVEDWETPSTPEDIRFLYTFKDEEGKTYFKIYNPFSVDYKWAGSVPLALPFGIQSLTCATNTLIITKSVKDCLVLRKFFPEVIALQNESKDAIKKETLAALKACYKYIYTWLDCDRTGIRASNYFMKTHGFTPIFTVDLKPNPFKAMLKAKKLAIKDPADFVKRYGIATFKQYLQHLKLI